METTLPRYLLPAFERHAGWHDHRAELSLKLAKYVQSLAHVQ